MNASLSVLCKQGRELAIQQRSIAQVEGKQAAQMADAVEIGFVADDTNLVGVMMRDVTFHTHTNIVFEAQFEQAGCSDDDFGNSGGNQCATQGQIEHAARPLTKTGLKSGGAAKTDSRIASALDGVHVDFKENLLLKFCVLK